jgi:hypothetical protein
VGIESVTDLEIVRAVSSMPSSEKLHSQGLGPQGTYIQILMSVCKATVYTQHLLCADCNPGKLLEL